MMGDYIANDKWYMAACKPKYTRLPALVKPIPFPVVTGKPNPLDGITMQTLRAYVGTLSADEKAALPALVRELVTPWSERGLAWQHVVLSIAHDPVAVVACGGPPYKKEQTLKVEYVKVSLGA